MPSNARLIVVRAEAEERIKARIDKGQEILDRNISAIDELEEMANEYSKWSAYNRDLLSQLFNECSLVSEYQGQTSFGYTFNVEHLEFFDEEVYGFKQQVYGEIKQLESIVERLEIIPEAPRINTAEISSEMSPSETAQTSTPCVFIGHGRSTLWARLKVFLQDELGVKAINYESESRVGESIVPILEKMLDQATFAVLVLTAEDETSDGIKRARQNVIHEAGLFQGRLGFRKAVLLCQEGLEDFTNIDGLQHIRFSGDKIDQTFYELQRALKREGLLSSTNTAA